jgi:hypothetical protein
MGSAKRRRFGSERKVVSGRAQGKNRRLRVGLWQAGYVELHAEDRAILAFECAWWTEPGLKIERIRTELSMSPSRYYKRLAELIDSPAAMEFDPLLIRRLRRRRHQETMLKPPAAGRNDQ